jgi:hypothetical protein
MGSSTAKATSSTKQATAPAGPVSTSAWLRAIIQAVGDEALTLDEIQRAVGEIIVTPETGAIEEYVEVLIQEGVLVDAHQTQHFALTADGVTLLEGVRASPSA